MLDEAVDGLVWLATAEEAARTLPTLLFFQLLLVSRLVQVDIELVDVLDAHDANVLVLCERSLIVNSEQDGVPLTLGS